MATELQVVNMALSHIGMKPITDLAGTDPSAVIVDTYWDLCLNDVFSEHRWPFANVKAALSEITSEDDDIEWDYYYTYPTSAARVWIVYNESTILENEHQEFEVLYLTGSTRKVIM